MTQKAMQQLFTFFILVKTGKAFEFLLPYFIYSPAGFFHLFFFSFFSFFFSSPFQVQYLQVKQTLCRKHESCHHAQESMETKTCITGYKRELWTNKNHHSQSMAMTPSSVLSRHLCCVGSAQWMAWRWGWCQSWQEQTLYAQRRPPQKSLSLLPV